MDCGRLLSSSMEQPIPRHIRLTSHPGSAGEGMVRLRWGATTPLERGPVVASPADPRHRNAIGSYSGAYAIYRALAVATRALAPGHRPDLTDTAPAALIGPHPQWTEPGRIVSLAPYGHLVGELFAEAIRAGPETRMACRVHDECNGSDVFGSDICTCRPYLVHGVEMCIEMAQQGGVGLVIYNRKEGRALGEVTKFLVYNARKRQQGGDRADTYFERTECVAGVQDVRFQELVPDVFHWLGVRRIDRWVSMSNMKHGAVQAQGIEIVERVALPERLVPKDAQVEIAAKKAAGYFAPEGAPSTAQLRRTKGRRLDT